jgi:hypothetical protein
MNAEFGMQSNEAIYPAAVNPEAHKINLAAFCRQHKYCYVVAETMDGRQYDGIIESADNDQVYMLLPAGDGPNDIAANDQRQFGSPFGFPGFGFGGFGFPGFGFPRRFRRFGRFGFPFFGIRRFFFPFFF